MAKNSDLSDRLYKFALRIILFVKSLPRIMIAYEIGKQLLKAGTSVAANYEEATGAFSREDFIYKVSTSFKEAKESNLWLRLLKDSNIVKSKELEDLIQESKEIKNILAKSLKTLRNKKQE